MYRLYYAEGSAAQGVRVLLEEMELSYELIHTSIDMTIPRDPGVLALNPNGWIPVLLWEDGARYEAGAITTFLCDRHPGVGMAPGPSEPERGLFLQWLFFFSSSIQNAYQMTYYPFRFSVDEGHFGSVNQRSIARLRELWNVVDDAAEGKEWMLGERFSAVDIYLFMLVTWLSTDHDHPVADDFPNVARIARKVMSRPSVRKVYAGYVSSGVLA